MKKLLSLVAFSSFCFAQLEFEGFIGLDTQIYSTKDNKHSTNYTLEQQLKFSYQKDRFNSVIEVYAQEDTKDYLKAKDNERSFIRLNELYFEYESDSYKISLGQNIKFWGALEVENIVDLFNTRDGRSDPFKIDKLGAYNISYSYFLEDGDFSIIAKLYEQEIKMARYPYMYSILNENEFLNDKLKTEKSDNRASLYLSYNSTVYGDEYSLDYALIYENGYDSQRYFTKNANQYTQHAYLVNKIMTYNTLVYNSTLYKLEALYTDVIDEKKVSDYIHLAFGVEHTLDALENGHEIGLISEYYYYDTLQDNKFNDIDLSISFQNDLFLGFRYSFKDVADSSIVGGVILDKEYDEQSYYVEYETRIDDIFKLKADYRYFEPSSSHDTTSARLGQHQRLALNISYHF